MVASLDGVGVVGRSARHFAAVLIIVFGSVLVTLVAPETSLAEDKSEGPAIWKATQQSLGGKATVYLFGTVHILEPDQVWFTPKIKSRFEEAHTLALEMADVKGSSPQAARLMRKLGTYPPRDSLANHVGERTYMRLQSTMSKLGAPPVALYRMRPWVALMVFNVHALAADGRLMSYGADHNLHKWAIQQKKRVIGLESMEAHLRTFADMPDAVQAEMLTDTLKGMNKRNPRYQPLVTAWLAGNADELGRLMDASMAKASPLIRQRVLIDRNRNWLKPIKRMLAGSGTYFVAAGAAHFAGEENVIDLLRARGVTVVRE